MSITISNVKKLSQKENKKITHTNKIKSCAICKLHLKTKTINKIKKIHKVKTNTKKKNKEDKTYPRNGCKPR